MAYYFSKTLPVGFDEAVQLTTEALKREGFGIITEIDVKKTLKDEDRHGLSQLPHSRGLQPEACARSVAA